MIKIIYFILQNKFLILENPDPEESYLNQLLIK